MKKIFAITFALALLAALLLPVTSAAAPPDWAPRGRPEQLPYGWQRLNPHTKAHTVSTEIIGGVTYATVEAEIDSLPTTLDDNVTLIDTNWYLLSDRSGQHYFQSGANLFTARVLGGRVSVEDKNGRLSVWNPTLTIGNKKFGGGTPYITDDPINPNYTGNCLKWTYGSYSDGWWLFGSSARVERYLRVIEGSISELWTIPIDPKANVTISLNEKVEDDYGAHVTWLNAYDAEGSPLRVTKDMSGRYVIRATEFADKKFPITIDPTEDFTTSAYDTYIYRTSYYSYAYARESASGTYEYQGGSLSVCGQTYYDAPEWRIYRAYVMFDTSSLPDNAVAQSATLKLYGYADPFYDVNFYVTIQSGMPTYPHMPVVLSDYNYLYYSGNGGQFWTGGWSTSSYNNITLNSTGMNWIDKTDWTKFCLRSGEDINGSEPYDKERVYFYAYEVGVGYAPKLSVTYSIPIVAPTVSTLDATGVTETYATLKGYLDDDGGETCSVRFKYTPYGGGATYTAWESGYATGQYFEKNVYGLTPGTEVAFIAQASNSGGGDDGATKHFTPYPLEPSNFTATGEEAQIALTWTKGSGADKTMIRRAEGSYPTTPSSDTQIYYDTGTSHDDTTATPGVTYYYSAWSWALNEYTSGGVYSQTKATDYAARYALANPTVTTNSATNVETTTATLNLYLDNLGGYGSTDVWFQYYKGAGTWTDNETTPTTKTAPGSHSKGITSLTTDTLYHVRAAAINTHGTSYGSDVPFTTDAPSAPTMTTQSATGVQLTSVTLNGTVTNDGDASVTAWFEYGLTIAYGDTSPTISGLGTSDTFYYNLGNLLPSTTYHYRAVGENTAGIGYGDDVEFTTATPSAPTLNTDDASEVGSNQATLWGTLTSDGGVSCEVRFQWGATDAYGTDTGWQTGFTSGMSFSQFISGLTIGETYHFRAQAKNAGGTTDGADKTFTTKFSPPTNFNTKAISSTTISLEWHKAGDQTYIRYKQTGFPIDREDGLPVYFGPGESASVSGLVAGTTYYFRAWSWREGSVWAEGYAEDVATTPPVATGKADVRPESVIIPEMPGGWFQAPSGAHLTQLPMYSVFVSFAEAYEVPEGTMWLTIGLLLVIGVAVFTFAKSHNPFVSTVAGGITIVVCSVLGMMPMWFVAIYLVLGTGFTFVARRI